MTIRIPVWAVATALATAMLAACGGDDPSSTPVSAANTTVTAPSTPVTASEES